MRLIYNIFDVYMYYLYNMLILYCVNVIVVWYSLNMFIILIMLDEICMLVKC